MQEQVTAELHEAQLNIAKTEGKLQAAQTRIGQAERDLNSKKTEAFELSEEVRKLRASLMQSGSDKEVENSALRHEVQILKEKNGDLGSEVQHLNELLEQEGLRVGDSEKLQSALAASKEEVQTLAQAVENKDIALQQKEHKLGVLADQLKVQKDKANEAMDQYRRTEDALSRMVGFGGEGASEHLVQRNRQLEGEIVQLHTEASQRHHELQVAINQREEAVVTVRSQGVELQQRIDQIDTLTSIIKRLQQPQQPPSPGATPGTGGEGRNLRMSFRSEGGPQDDFDPQALSPSGFRAAPISPGGTPHISEVQAAAQAMKGGGTSL
eukprot:CAMPEP_0184305808 /NCGR_PEP_ID=MMETSP1049-20130417/14983_1 /TAXON_ID=77928 /ORGANISM="Proteomonas sulcata, Strain CCMP704" /LENGTH=324 /DNA_ID=CAMNT_0026617951 /DNA_START=87 /DNA_END=1061 /DNA_ORIENTATION=+